MPHQNTPNGWKEVKLGEIGKVSMCKRILKKQTSEFGDIPFYKIGTFGKNSDAFISREIFENFKQKYSFPKKGEILISASGTIGRTVVYDGEPAYFQDSNIVWISNNEEQIYNTFLFYSYKKVKWQTESGTIPRLYNDNIRAIKLLLPPLPEQNRIVSVLQTWDELIEKLEQKIAVKKRIKKGLMQQLLTGKKRLAGFEGEWETVKLGDIGEIITGNTPPKKDIENYGNIFCWATAEDFKQKYIKDTNIKLSEKGKNISRPLPIGALLITCIASIGKNAIAKTPLATNQQINSIVLNENFSNEFFYYLISFQKNKLLNEAGSGAVKLLSKSSFSSLVFKTPALPEQTAIAKILTTADEEIETLEKKLELFQSQKKFLLNNLITGKIPTPESLVIKS